jgi:hypothetical protein
MSFFAQQQAAATEAQSILAQLQGMDAGAVGNVLYGGANHFGTFGNPVVTEVMNAMGGYRKRTTIPLTMTRDQFTAAPKTQDQLARTDQTPPITYRIDNVDTDDPMHYVIELVRVGT